MNTHDVTTNSGSWDRTNLDRVRLPCISGLEIPHDCHRVPLPRPFKTLSFIPLLLLLLLLLLMGGVMARFVTRVCMGAQCATASAVKDTRPVASCLAPSPERRAALGDYFRTAQTRNAAWVGDCEEHGRC